MSGSGSLPTFFLALYILANLAAFLVMLWDKSRSKVAREGRVSEGMMFFMAAMFCAVGVYLGMLLFHHKTRKWYFIIGIPAMILENLATLYLVSRYFV